MMNIKSAVENLQWNAEHHYAHIEAKHDFIRAIAVQFELGYTDFRFIQTALLSANMDDKYRAFTEAYEDFYQYESFFAMRGLEEYQMKYGDKLSDFRQAKDNLLKILETLI